MGHRLIRAIAVILGLTALLTTLSPAQAAPSPPCRGACSEVDLGEGNVFVTARDVVKTPDGPGYTASNTAPLIPTYQWRLRTPCELDPGDVRACVPGLCPVIAG